MQNKQMHMGLSEFRVQYPQNPMVELNRNTFRDRQEPKAHFDAFTVNSPDSESHM